MRNYKIGCFVAVLLTSAFLIYAASQNNSIYIGIVISLFLFWFFKSVFFTSEEDKRENEERNRQYEEAQKKREQLKITAIEELKKMKIDKMKAEWSKYYKRNQFSFIDKLSGVEFEEFLLKILKEKGYTNVRLTNETGDQGMDILFTDSDGKEVGIQAKRYSGSVGNSAVQQLLGGMLYYSCQKGIIATTSKFTQSAIELASKDSRISLWERNKIEKLYYDTMPSEIPPFSIEKAKQIGLSYHTRLPRFEIEKIFKKYDLDYRYDYKSSDIDQ